MYVRSTRRASCPVITENLVHARLVSLSSFAASISIEALHLPRLKLIASTGSRNASIDMEAAKELKETSRAWTKFSVITGQEARRVERTYIKDQGKNGPD